MSVDTNSFTARIRDSLPPYEGKDCNLSEEWNCKYCYTTAEEINKEKLSTCSGCMIVRYCSKKCQKKDRSDHASTCKTIRKLTTSYDTHTRDMQVNTSFRTFTLGISPPSNLFETQTGYFWNIHETRDYCRSRFQLATELKYLGHDYEVKPLLEQALHHKLELLRLIESDNMGIRESLPFLLLRLNRDDDCFDFIRYWSIQWDERPINHSETTEGQWIYPRDGNKLEKVCPDDKENYGLSLAFTAALCIIKLRLIATYESRLKQSEAFRSTKAGKRLGEDLLDRITRCIVSGNDGLTKEVIQEQESQLAHYFSLVQKKNAILLPAIVNPGPLKSQPQPRYVSAGHPSEAYGVLNDCNRDFLRIPGALDRITAIVGENPTYDCDIEQLPY